MAVGALLSAFVLAVLAGLPAPALANDVSVTVMSGFTQREGADVKIKDSSGNEVASGTTAREGGTGRPKFKTDLPPGTYTIDASWLNSDTGRTETGTMTYTVSGNKNEPNVVVAEGGAGSRTGQAAGAAAGAAGMTERNDGGGVRLSLGASYQVHWADGITALPLFDGGQATGANLINEDADTDGYSTEVRVGARLPNVSPGSSRSYVSGRITRQWGDSTFRADQVMAPTGQTFEIPGIGALNAIGGFNQIDNVSAESEIENWEGGIAYGMKFDEDFSPGSPGSPFWGSPSPGGGLNGANGHRPVNYFAVRTELFGGLRTQTDTLSFEQGGSANRIVSEIDTRRIGLQSRVSFNRRLSNSLRFSLGATAGVTYNDSDLDASQVRGNDTDSATDSDSNFSPRIGASLALQYRLPVGRVEAGVSVLNDFNVPHTHLANSNDDTTRIDYADQLSVDAGLRYIVNTGQVFASDRRLKRNIRRVGALPSGLPVYAFQYIWSSATYVGVMAQEAMLVFPEAVHEIDGFLAVDYSRIR